MSAVCYTARILAFQFTLFLPPIQSRYKPVSCPELETGRKTVGTPRVTFSSVAFPTWTFRWHGGPRLRGASGPFRENKAATAASGDCKAVFTVFLKNGTIEGEISPLSLKVRCSLREPVVDQTFTVPELVAEVIPSKCTYEIQDGVVIMKLYKADRSRPWALELAGNGLNSSISNNLTADPPKNA
ncbi:hypothetical protein SprV_0802571500 [Sparganum proliferum]